MFKKLLKGVGFSKGCAALTLKKPPPFVPSCLMASCDATGPTATICSLTTLPLASLVACNNATWCAGEKVCTTPCDTKTSARTIDSGRST